MGRGNATILEIVFDRIRMGQHLAPVGQCQQEGRDAEGDDQGGQYQRLRQRVGQHLIAAVEDRSGPGRPAGPEQKQVGTVADQPEPDDDPGEYSLHDQVGTGGEQGAGGEGQDRTHCSSLSGSPSSLSTVRINPTTTR